MTSDVAKKLLGFVNMEKTDGTEGPTRDFFSTANVLVIKRPVIIEEHVIENSITSEHLLEPELGSLLIRQE